MANYAYIWELGGGLGHLQRMRAVSQQAVEAGHAVRWYVPPSCVAAATACWPNVLPAPVEPRPRARVVEPGSFAEILQNEGWADPARLKSWISLWQREFRDYQPDHVLLDFAPNALAAAIADHQQVTVLGTGFYIPPRLSPLPSFRQDLGVYADRLLWAEQQLTAVATEALGQPLNGLCDLLHHANVDNHLLTYAAWDHYPNRGLADQPSRYCGLSTSFSGRNLDWRGTSRRRVFAYLKPFPHLPALLHAFHQLDLDVEVHGSAGIARLVRSLDSSSIRYCEQPVDERSVAAAGAVMINHAGHDGSIKAALAGLALWQIPLNAEQLLTCHNAQRLGMAEWTHSFAHQEFVAALGRLLDEQPKRQQSARDWANSVQPGQSFEGSDLHFD